MSAAETESASTPSSQARVAAAVDDWVRELTDLGGRNTLLWYQDLALGTLDLTHAHPSGLAMLLAGRPTRLSALVREPGSLADSRRRARAIGAKTLELAEERGIAGGWLAVGLASWDVAGTQPPPAAPVLLRSCSLRPRGVTGEDFDLDLGPAAELNPVLVHHLADEYGVRLDAEVVAELAMTGDGFDPHPVLDRIAETCRHVPGFGIEHRLVVSTFASAWLPLVSDLHAQRDGLAGHPVVAALAGEPQARSALAASWTDPLRPAGDVDPSSEHLVLDADASQQAVVDAVLAGAHLVVDGPPGTGKSQTIANLVASLAAAGRRTLFVAQKRASVDTVLDRLAAVGLRELVLDLPDGAGDHSRIARQVGVALDQVGLASPTEPRGSGQRRSRPPDVEPAVATLVERRSRLTGHVEALHAVRQPWGVSAYQAQRALAELTDRRPAPRSRVRVRGAALSALDRHQLDVLREELHEAASLGAFRGGPDDDPWFGAVLRTPAEADEALEKVTLLVQQALPHARETLTALLAAAGMPEGRSLAEWGRALALVGSVRSTLEVFAQTVFDQSLADAVAATAPKAWRRERGISLGRWQRRRLARQARRLLRPGAPPDDLHAALELAHRQREQWQVHAGPGARPQLPPGLDAAEQAYLDAAEPAAWLSERLAGTAAGGDLAAADVDTLTGRLELLAERTSSLPVVPRVVALRERLRAAGLEPLLADLASRDVPPQDVGSELDLVWWTSVLEQVATADPRYGAHDGDLLRRAGEEFAAADRAHLAGAAQRVRRASADRLAAVVDRHPEQTATLRAEAAETRRRRTVRQLVLACPEVLAAATPCWALSPLIVPQMLPPGERFDVVVFDEASQLPTAQAIAAISRARQVVVLGDERQLPPSAFEASASTDDAAGGPSSGDVTDDRESLLDVLSRLLRVVHLRRHYRSGDERLVAFTNARVYDGELLTFPGAGDGQALRFEQVDGRAVLAPDAEAVESTDAEVRRVVELVLEHARNRPAQSLGVVALGTRHAQRVDDAVRLAVAEHPEVAPFFGDDRPERFFVKYVDQVQGDERDAIVLTVGYGRTPHGRVLHRFGPLSQPGGARRLTVATTRARCRMTVVASFGADDLDPDRLSTPGPRLLRDYLAYVAAGGRLPEQAGPSPDDALLADLASRLRAQGLLVNAEHGQAASRIELAVGPDDAGLVLAVETDGPRYAAEPNSRERDRLRTEQLELRGWKHLRIWSTDVFRDPAREVARISALATALAGARGGAS